MASRGSGTWQLACSEEEANGGRILVVRGRIGFESAPVFEAAVQNAFTGAGLILDVTGVDYISSAGLTVLERASKTAPASLVVCGASEAVRLTFELAGLLPELRLASTRKEAAALLESGPSKPAGLANPQSRADN